MAATQYRCGSARRRTAVRDASPATLNGIDFVEVRADKKTLDVVFLHNLPGTATAPVPPGPAPALEVGNLSLEGGVRIRGLHVAAVSSADNVLTVEADAPGDFSTYTLQVRTSPTDDTPPAGFDPQLASVDFSFRVDCPNDFDCATVDLCPPTALVEPEIDYLAKDFTSFRRLMLDRMSVLAPAWQERNVADGHVAVVELLAYAGDRLSYFQDAVATEAYLGTARERISLRRHARLLDYFMHSGANARAWVTLDVAAGSAADGSPLAAGTLLLTRGPEVETIVAPVDVGKRLAEGPLPFETMHAVGLHASHSRISFYTWSDAECCLPTGSTRATLANDPLLALVAGDVLLLEEIVSPTTGAAADADPLHRHAVRLTSAVAGTDPLDGTPVLEVQWGSDDALPFPLCISALVADPDGAIHLTETGVARGNVVLADHGLSVPAEPLVPAVAPDDRAYRPSLAHAPLTFRGSFDPAAPATAATRFEIRSALPVVRVTGEGETWLPVFDLLRSDRFATEFAVELASDGTAQLRFGNGERGRAPEASASFDAAYRIGNGASGNVGAESITRVVTTLTGIRSARNPLPAIGGADPEPLERVRLDAPEAFRTQQRAVTESDYASVAQRNADVQRATAAFRWTGSWYTVYLTVDRVGGREVDAPFEQRLETFVDGFRMAGHDLELGPPVTVPLDIALDVCAKQGYFRANVEQAILERLSSRQLGDGRRGFFHPDNFTFGQPVYLSQIYAAVSELDGVGWVEATLFQRFGKEPAGELESESILPGAREVARLDNDPNFPENGRLQVHVGGGL